MERTPCKYHQLGTCQYGNKCMNEHSKRCYFFFVEYSCAFGSTCKWDHGSAGESSSLILLFEPSCARMELFFVSYVPMD
jgi:hypothetical protein